jgi:hypothetical protein
VQTFLAASWLTKTPRTFSYFRNYENVEVESGSLNSGLKKQTRWCFHLQIAKPQEKTVKIGGPDAGAGAVRVGGLGPTRLGRLLRVSRQSVLRGVTVGKQVMIRNGWEAKSFW